MHARACPGVRELPKLSRLSNASPPLWSWSWFVIDWGPRGCEQTTELTMRHVGPTAFRRVLLCSVLVLTDIITACSNPTMMAETWAHVM